MRRLSSHTRVRLNSSPFLFPFRDHPSSLSSLVSLCAALLADDKLSGLNSNRVVSPRRAVCVTTLLFNACAKICDGQTARRPENCRPRVFRRRSKCRKRKKPVSRPFFLTNNSIYRFFFLFFLCPLLISTNVFLCK